MSGQVFEAGSEVLDIVDDLVRSDLPELLKIYDPQTVQNSQSQIAFMFSEKAGKSGGLPVLAKTGKVSPKTRPLLRNPNIQFIVDIAYDEWMGLSDIQRRALIFHELSKFKIEENPESGELKTSLRPPDISYFFEELERFGHWRPSPVEEEGGELPTNQYPEEVLRLLNIKPASPAASHDKAIEDLGGEEE